MLAAAIAMLLAAGPSAADPAPKGPHSWGKPGVTFLQYRTDAAECAYQVGTRSKVEIPKIDAVYASEMLGDLSDPDKVGALASDSQRNGLLERYDVYDKLEADLRRCLRERGYRPFRLDEAQRAQLASYRPGTQARQEYLYSLSVDPAVLANQGL